MANTTILFISLWPQNDEEMETDLEIHPLQDTTDTLLHTNIYTWQHDTKYFTK